MEELISKLESKIKDMDLVIAELDYSNEEESTRILLEYQLAKEELDTAMMNWEKATEELMELDYCLFFALAFFFCRRLLRFIDFLACLDWLFQYALYAFFFALCAIFDFALACFASMAVASSTLEAVSPILGEQD